MSDDFLSLVSQLRVLADDEQRLISKMWNLRADDDLSLKEALRGKEADLARVLLKTSAAIHTDAAKTDLLGFIASLCRDSNGFAVAFALDPAAKDFVAQPLTGASDVLLSCVAYALRFNSNVDATATAQFMRQVTTALEKRTSETAVEASMHALTVFLRRKALRNEFRAAGGVAHLMAVIHQYCADISANVQLLYDTLFCAWVCMYDCVSLETLHQRKLIPIVHDVLKRSMKEKCIRIALIIMSSLIALQDRYQSGEDMLLAPLAAMNSGKGPRFFTDMVGIGVLKTVRLLQKRSWGDDDVVAYLDELEKKLQENLEDLTTFSEYVGEVQSGVLEWSPAHTSVKFWKENLRNFEAKEFDVLRELAELLKTSTHETTLAVACHDFGELVRHHPQGRKILALSVFGGVKERILELMTSQSPEVSRHALLATQKIMVQRWEFLGQ
eukprot:PhM_4_TR13551/c0_g1_i1/m.104372/K02144/ATPeV1H; V-type H+-transporting ATPase subunit H